MKEREAIAAQLLQDAANWCSEVEQGKPRATQSKGPMHSLEDHARDRILARFRNETRSRKPGFRKPAPPFRKPELRKPCDSFRKLRDSGT